MKHTVTGYDPDDITVTIKDGQVRIDGKHVCTCDENCITREFSRPYHYQLDSRIDPQSVTATLDKQGTIMVRGSLSGKHHQHIDKMVVKVTGLGIPQSTRPSADELRRCLGEKGGIKLNRVNKSTGRVHVEEAYKYDHEVLRPEVVMSSEDTTGDGNSREYDIDVEIED